jgi:hypothetical protein
LIFKATMSKRKSVFVELLIFPPSKIILSFSMNPDELTYQETF